jgi:hypothetical protein
MNLLASFDIQKGEFPKLDLNEQIPKACIFPPFE